MRDGNGDYKDIDNDALDRYITGNYGEDQFKGPYYCTICGVNEVDAEDGFDTCEECLSKQ